MGFILFVVSVTLTLIVASLGLVIIIFTGFFQLLFNLLTLTRPSVSLSEINVWFMKNAILIDMLGNTLLYPIFNQVLLIDFRVHPFGKTGETISDNLGDNKKIGNLTDVGLILCNVLNFFEKEHVEKSANEDYPNSRY